MVRSARARPRRPSRRARLAPRRTTRIAHSSSPARWAGFGSRTGTLAEGNGRLSEALAGSAATGRTSRPCAHGGGLARGSARRRRRRAQEARRGNSTLARARRPRRARLGARHTRLASHLLRRRRHRPRSKPSSRASSSAASSATTAARSARSSASARCSSRSATQTGRSRSRAICSSVRRGDPRTEHYAFHFLADCALIRGDTEEAERRYRESLRAALRSATSSRRASRCRESRWPLAGLGDAGRALVLAAAVEALWESLGTSISIAFWDALLERYIGGARAQLGADADAALGGRPRDGFRRRRRARAGRRRLTALGLLTSFSPQINLRLGIWLQPYPLASGLFMI